MGYGEYLRQLLRPLGVYDLSEGSYSGGEVAALGAALDALDAYAQAKQKEAMVLTAEGEGLEQMESLFSRLMTAQSLKERREAISGFLQVSGDSFTEESLSRCLAACGTACMVRQTREPNVVCVRFPSQAGEPPQFAEKKAIIESILPCHLEIRYDFTWCTWEGLGGMTWEQAANLSFLQLSLWNLE